MRAKLNRSGRSDQSRILHQIAYIAMQVRCRVVDILSILYADQVRNFRGKQQAAIPTRQCSAGAMREVKRLILLLRHCLQALVHIIRFRGHSVSAIERHAIGSEPIGTAAPPQARVYPSGPGQ
jgi:hypothetical protein